MAWMSSITNTVLPTPAPPNIAAFPPWASGARRSITLTPVENRRVAPVWAANVGGLRWIGQRGASAGRGGPRSPIRPRTSIRRPRIASPTWIVTGPPAPRARSPRLSPVVGSSAIARAERASSWAWISATTMRPSASTISTASSIGGGPSSNTRSTTAPRIAATRPSNRPSLDIKRLLALDEASAFRTAADPRTVRHPAARR